MLIFKVLWSSYQGLKFQLHSRICLVHVSTSAKSKLIGILGKMKHSLSVLLIWQIVNLIWHCSVIFFPLHTYCLPKWILSCQGQGLLVTHLQMLLNISSVFYQLMYWLIVPNLHFKLTYMLILEIIWWFIFNLFYLFINLFLAVLGLHCCAQAFL